MEERIQESGYRIQEIVLIQKPEAGGQGSGVRSRKTQSGTG
jgi:hypothetical protein